MDWFYPLPVPKVVQSERVGIRDIEQHKKRWIVNMQCFINNKGRYHTFIHFSLSLIFSYLFYIMFHQSALHFVPVISPIMCTVGIASLGVVTQLSTAATGSLRYCLKMRFNLVRAASFCVRHSGYWLHKLHPTRTGCNIRSSKAGAGQTGGLGRYLASVDALSCGIRTTSVCRPTVRLRISNY